MNKIRKVTILLCLILLLVVSASATNLGQTNIADSNNGKVEFPFTVILTDENGVELEGEFSYTGTKSGVISSGDIVYLGDDDFIDIENLPEGTKYMVTEGKTEGFKLESSKNTTGSIVDGEISSAEFTNKEESFTPVMPDTGGEGTTTIVIIGVVLVATMVGQLSFTRKANKIKE